MPEGTDETTAAPETAAPEAAPEPAAPEASHPTGVQEPEQEAPAPEEAAPPPDLTDAMAQLNARLDRAGVPPAQEDSGLWDTLNGQPEQEYDDEYGYDDQGQQQAGPEQLTEEQQVAQELDRRIEERAQATIMPYLQGLEQERREGKILELADKHPRMREPEVIQAIDQRLGALADRYQNPALRTDPDAVYDAYLAYEARRQTSTPPAGGEQGTAEAVGQEGATLETGAGPSAPPADLSPEEQAYAQALSPGTNVNKFGL